MESGAPPPDRPRGDDPTARQPPPAPAPERPPAAGAPPGGWEQEIAARPQQWTGPPLAGWWRRVGAYILDGLIAWLVFYIGVTIVVAGAEVTGALIALVGLVAAFFYFPVTMSRAGEHNGKSLGKQALEIRVARDTGEPVTFGYALLRQFVVIYLLFQVVGGVAFGIPWLIDVLWPLWDRENRALHDMIVTSHVLRA